MYVGLGLYVCMYVVSCRSLNENCTKDLDLHTKWAPFDVIELRDSTAAFDGITQANQPPI